MPDFDLDAALELPEAPFSCPCPTCGQGMPFVRAVFEQADAWAEFVCQSPRCANRRRGQKTKQLEMMLVDVTTQGAEPVGNPMWNIRDSRCLYGCGRSSISTGASRLDGQGVEVDMSCDECDGTWLEFYNILEVQGA